MSGTIAPYVIWNLLCLNPNASSMRMCPFGLLIMITSIVSGTLIMVISWKHCPLNSYTMFSSEVSFGPFLYLAFAIAHNSHTGNIPLERFIPSWCAIFLVMSSLRYPKYSWACLTLILKIFLLGFQDWSCLI
jgi:hypothetical protein